MYICKKTNFFHEFYGGLAKLYVISWKQPFSFYATLIVYWIHIKIEYYNASDFSFKTKFKYTQGLFAIKILNTKYNTFGVILTTFQAIRLKKK